MSQNLTAMMYFELSSESDDSITATDSGFHGKKQTFSDRQRKTWFKFNIAQHFVLSSTTFIQTWFIFTFIPNSTTILSILFLLSRLAARRAWTFFICMLQKFIEFRAVQTVLGSFANNDLTKSELKTIHKQSSRLLSRITRVPKSKVTQKSSKICW